jgi:hypothetical protein
LEGDVELLEGLSVLVESSLTIGFQPRPQIPFEQMSTLDTYREAAEAKRCRVSGIKVAYRYHGLPLLGN